MNGQNKHVYFGGIQERTECYSKAEMLAKIWLPAYTNSDFFQEIFVKEGSHILACFAVLRFGMPAKIMLYKSYI